jgi:hypothetical protein
MFDWLASHWEWIVSVAVACATVGATLAVSLVEFFGDGRPRLVKVLGIAISVFSWVRAAGAHVKSRGLRIAIGGAELQVPGLSASSPETSKERVVRRTGEIKAARIAREEPWK